MSRCCTQGKENGERTEKWWPGSPDGGHLCTPLGCVTTRPSLTRSVMTRPTHETDQMAPALSARHRLLAWRASETSDSVRKDGLGRPDASKVGGLLCPSIMQTSSTAASTQLAGQRRQPVLHPAIGMEKSDGQVSAEARQGGEAEVHCRVHRPSCVGGGSAHWNSWCRLLATAAAAHVAFSSSCVVRCPARQLLHWGPCWADLKASKHAAAAAAAAAACSH